jgi:type IV pilus assembly protein PilN
MRLNLNLATQPYAEGRRFVARWTMILGLVSVATAALVFFAVSALRSYSTAKQEQASVQADIAREDQIRANAQSYLNQPQNRDTRDKSKFLNELIARKAFSWTQVFSDLEKLMPDGLHVVQITPTVNENSQLEVKLQVNGRTRDRAIELVKRLEDSTHFTQPRIEAETNGAAIRGAAGAGTGLSGLQAGDVTQFQISAIYVPSFERGGKP